MSAVAATDILNKAAKRIVVFKKFIPIGVIFVLIGGKINTKIWPQETSYSSVTSF